MRGVPTLEMRGEPTLDRPVRKYGLLLLAEFRLFLQTFRNSDLRNLNLFVKHPNSLMQAQQSENELSCNIHSRSSYHGF